MPNRIIRDGILTSVPVASLGWAEEVFYRRLMSVADDFGRFYAMPALIRAACYPLQIAKVSDADIGKWLRSCEVAGLVSVYQAADGNSYLCIIKFGQQVRAKKSKYPESLASASKCEQVLADAHLDVSVSVSVSEDVFEGAAAPAEGITFLPDWLPASAWKDFVAHRKAIKKPMTALAEVRMLKNLVALKGQGVDVVAAMDTAIRSGWSDVYAPKQQPGHKPASNLPGGGRPKLA